jgi:hypothetical protein
MVIRKEGVARYTHIGFSNIISERRFESVRISSSLATSWVVAALLEHADI